MARFFFWSGASVQTFWLLDVTSGDVSISKISHILEEGPSVQTFWMVDLVSDLKNNRIFEEGPSGQTFWMLDLDSEETLVRFKRFVRNQKINLAN